MVDPVSALSFTGNIIQFIDFSSKVISGSREIYRGGLPGQYVDLKAVAESLRELTIILS
jgi:hypothetical protein